MPREPKLALRSTPPFPLDTLLFCKKRLITDNCQTPQIIYVLDITFFLKLSSTYGIHYLMKLIFVQLKVLHVPLNVSRLTILSATSNVICFLLCIVFTMSTCMLYNYCARRSTVSALCALLSCLSVWTNKWWWWWWWWWWFEYKRFDLETCHLICIWFQYWCDLICDLPTVSRYTASHTWSFPLLHLSCPTFWVLKRHWQPVIVASQKGMGTRVITEFTYYLNRCHAMHYAGWTCRCRSIGLMLTIVIIIIIIIIVNLIRRPLQVLSGAVQT